MRKTLGKLKLRNTHKIPGMYTSAKAIKYKDSKKSYRPEDGKELWHIDAMLCPGLDPRIEKGH